jgi:hypothetical protein
VRDVLHALLGARQLETIAVAGKTLWHIPGMLPVAEAAAAKDAAEAATEAEMPLPLPKKVGTGRIGAFKSERRHSSEFQGKPARRFAAGAARPKPRFGPRSDGKSDQQRRPFQKAGGQQPTARKTFTKPWEEDSKPRPRAAAAGAAPDAFRKFRRPEPEDRAPLGPREQAGLPEAKRSYAKLKPAAARFDSAGQRDAPAGKPYRPRAAAAAPRRAFGSSVRTGAGAKGEGARAFKPRSFDRAGSKEGFAGTSRSFAGKSAAFPRKPGKFAGKRPFSPGASGAAAQAGNDRLEATSAASERTIPKRPYKPRAADADKRKFTKAPYRASAEEASSGGGRRTSPSREKGGFAARGPAASKGFGARPAAKLGGGPKPFQKAGAKRSGAFGAGGAKPSARKKPKTEE